MNDLLLSLIGLVFATAFVLLLAYVCLRLIKRFQPRGGEGDAIGFMRAVQVGPRERITLVRYRGEVFMLGVAGGSVSLLARFDDTAQRPVADGTVAPPPFASRLEDRVTRLRTGNGRDYPR